MTDPRLTGAERARVVRLLRESRDDVLAALEPATDAQWTFRPEADRWSIGLIAEHLGLVERRLFGQVELALEQEANPDWEVATAGKDTLINRTLLDRSARRDAPDLVVPAGAIGRDEAIRVFVERRAHVLVFAETTTAPLKAHSLDHHRPLYGALSAYQWLLYIPLHTMRHMQQIAEIPTAPGYPVGA